MSVNSQIDMAEMSVPLTHPPDSDEHAQTKSLGTRKSLACLGLFLAVGLVIVGVGQWNILRPAAEPTDPVQRALDLMSRYPLIDGHNDLAWQYRLNGSASVYNASSFDLRYNMSSSGLQTDIPRLRLGRVGGQFWSVYVRCYMADAVRSTLEEIDIVRSFVARYATDFQMAYTADDIGAAFAAGKVASLMGIEGGHSIDSSYGALRQFYNAGVRYMTLTHNCNTPWSESCCDEKEPNPDFATVGLTAGSQGFNGQGVVAEMNRIGMMVDLSHTSQRTMRDALRYSRAPVIFSHSGVYDLVQVERNVRTDIIQSLHQQGGLLMVFFYSNYTSTRGVNNASSIADHFDAIKAICQGSVDAIGVGSDFDGDDLFGEGAYPDGLKNVGGFPNLIAELIRRGYTDQEIVAIMGGNLQRVMRAVESVAQQMQQEQVQNEARLFYKDDCRSEF